MDQKVLGMDQNQFYTLVFIILLVILGVVSFHYYTYVSATDSLSAGAGVGLTILPKKK